MNRLYFAVFAVIVLSINIASASTVELTRGSGLPGEKVTLYLNIDNLPVDDFAGFSLDLELHFDPAKLTYIARSAKKVGIFRDENDGSGSAPPSDFSSIAESSKPNLLSLGLLGSYTRGVPAGGALISLDFMVASDASNGEIPIELKLLSSSDDGVSAVRNGAVAVSAVPVPPALLLFGAPLAWLLARVRRG